MAAALVCKRWESLSKAPELWRDLHLCNISELTTETVEMLLERSKGIKYINLNCQCSLVWDSVISKIAEQKKLQELQLGRLDKDIDIKTARHSISYVSLE